MELSELKKNLHLLIDDVENEEILKEIHLALQVFKKSEDNEQDFWDMLSPSLKGDIEKALEEIKEGKTISNDDIKNEARKWLMK